MTQGEHNQAPEAPVLSRRAALRLAGVAAGGVLSGGYLWSRDRSYPDEGARGSRMYDYHVDRAKFKSPAFMVGNRLADSILCFGSSEFSVSPNDIPEVPRALFGWHDYGLDMWEVGEGYNQCLWHAIAMGAYARALDERQAQGGTVDVAAGVFDAANSRKAVFFISPQWFYEGGVPNNATQTQFGYGLWRGICQNPKVDPARLDYLAGRLRDSGIEATKVAAGLRRTLPDALNDLAYDFAESHDLKAHLVGLRKDGGDPMPAAKANISAAEGVPDWDALEAHALELARANTTTNDFGILDTFWQQHNASDFAAGKLKGFQKNRSLTKAPTEDADLACALGVANDCGFDLLCVIMPFPGDWMDYQELSRDERARRYELIREACEAAQVRVADFSGDEYTRYFNYDGTHLGWLGWLAVNRAIYEFAMGE